MFIPVAEWLPDQPPFNNPGGNRATNVIPGYQSYLPMPSPSVVSTGIGGRVLGAIFARDNADNNYVYAGDQSAIYVQAATSLNAITHAAFSVDASGAWEFVPWNQTVIAVNGFQDTPVQISLGATTAVDITGMPKAKHIAVINNFVVIGNISDSGTQVQRIRWSSINNASAWTPDATTLSDYQDLPGDGGWVQKIIGGEQGGYVFQERRIYAMNFVGSPLIFQFNPVHLNVGAYAAEGVINYENIVFFLSDSGFYSFDGTNLTPIGKGKVDNTFFADLDRSYIINIRAAIWPTQKVVGWAYPGAGNVGGRCNHILLYSYAYDRWSRIDIPATLGSGIDLFAELTSPAYTLEGLDAVSSSIDALPFSLDDSAWKGGQIQIGAFIGGGIYYFSGIAMSADVETSEMNPQQNIYPNTLNAQEDNLRLRSQLSEIWPMVDGISASSMTVAVSTRDKLTDASSYSVALSPISAGFVESRINGRFFRFRIRTNGQSDFNFIQGVDIRFEGAGKR